MDDLERTGIRYVTYFDEKYPDRLKDISDYPLVLFYRGHLEYTEAEYAIGIVGSRRPSFYGLNTAEEFVSINILSSPFCNFSMPHLQRRLN